MLAACATKTHIYCAPFWLYTLHPVYSTRCVYLGHVPLKLSTSREYLGDVFLHVSMGFVYLGAVPLRVSTGRVHLDCAL